SFPPPPPSEENRHHIISGFCENMSPDNFVEKGCAVCGRLTIMAELTLMSEVTLNWDLLANDEATRRERNEISEPIQAINGPVLAAGCDSVCTECESALRRHVAPTHSLSNHLWLGEVPWQLKDLSFAEKMLIAKVRHNRCVVRVASGRGKLTGNAIMFASPVAKVYN
ncbi:hypothetical protein K438DRAFT_1482473, partial [Mycena galopus ATCC 62051]